MKIIGSASSICLYLCLVSASVANAVEYDSLSGTGTVNRTDLTYDLLTSSTLIGSTANLVDYGAFAVPSGAANPDHVFQGTLTLNPQSAEGGFTEVGTNLISSYRNPGHLPAFSYQFIQHGTHIIPVQRGLLATTHPDWDYILEPGRVWKESTDNGYSRVAIPFALQEKGANCTHNGVLSFLFKSDGNVSHVVYQIASETCAYFQFNMWGILAATYMPHAIPGSVAAISSYESEVTARMPTKPIAQLASDYPSAGIVTANFGSEQTATYMTAFGVAVDGIHYVGGCGTRYGTYPYCDVMDLPSYSIAKSVAGAIGLMRLTQKYAGTQHSIIQAEVENCSGSQWLDVSLLNALDMATGNFTSSGYEADEGSTDAKIGFFLERTHSAKANFACSYQRKATPGAQWVYRTSDSFLLGTAMNSIYKRRDGGSKDFYSDMLVAELWKPLKMSPTTYTTSRTTDPSGQPLTGYGLTFHRDDLVKIGEFINKDDGRIGGVPMLDGTLLKEAMQRTANHGLEAGSIASKYQHGFWAWNAASAATGAAICSDAKWIPYMSGYGGIGLVMLPNNMVFYFVSDHFEYGFKKALVELNKIRSLC